MIYNVHFREPEVVERQFTAVGAGIPVRFPGKTEAQTMLYIQLLDGPCLSAFDAGFEDPYVVGPSPKAVQAYLKSVGAL